MLFHFYITSYYFTLFTLFTLFILYYIILYYFYIIDGQVMVPGIDLADHDSNPSCFIIEDRNKSYFSLISNTKINKGSCLSIDYGPLSSDELLSDYGFTVDNNPYDRMLVNCDHNLINTARSIMGQDTNNNNNNQEDLGSMILPSTTSSVSSGELSSGISSSSSIIGRGGGRLNDQSLHQWQVSLPQKF